MPTKIYEDNKSCFALVTNPNSNKRSKHFAVKCAFVNDLIEKNQVDIHYCPTDLMLADILDLGLFYMSEIHGDGCSEQSRGSTISY